MLKKSQILAGIHLCLDMGLLMGSFIAAYFTKKYLLPAPYAGISTIPNYYVVLLLILMTGYLSFNFYGFYRSYLKVPFSDIIKRLIKGITCTFLFTLLLLYIMKASEISRIMFTLFLVYSFTSLLISKILIYSFVSLHHKRSYHHKNILIIGSRERAKELIRNIKRKNRSSYHVIGCLDLSYEQVGKRVANDVCIIGTMQNFHRILEDHPIDEIVFALPLALIKNVKDYIAFAEEVGINIRLLPDWQLHKIMHEPEKAQVSFQNIEGVKTVLLSSQTHQEGALFIKLLLDYSVAGLTALALLPLFCVISIAIKLTSKGPVFFCQTRCGKYGRKFPMIKFRTMVADAEKIKNKLMQHNEVDGPVFKMKNDPRITFIGRILRKTSLDELPQLINILRGEMSLVGPRPPIPDEVEQYKPWQRRRLSVKPGLTCIWQVSGRNNVEFKSWMNMDLEYIDRWSLWLDFKLLFYTIPAVLFGTGK